MSLRTCPKGHRTLWPDTCPSCKASTPSAKAPRPGKPKRVNQPRPHTPQPFPDIHDLGCDGLQVDFWRGAARLRKRGEVIVLTVVEVRQLHELLNRYASRFR